MGSADRQASLTLCFCGTICLVILPRVYAHSNAATRTDAWVAPHGRGVDKRVDRRRACLGIDSSSKVMRVDKEQITGRARI